MSTHGGNAVIPALLGILVVAIVGSTAALMLRPQSSSTPAADHETLVSEIRRLRAEVDGLRARVDEMPRLEDLWIDRTADSIDPAPEEARGPESRESPGANAAEAGERGRGRRGGELAQVRELTETENVEERLALARKMLEDENPMVQLAALRTLIQLAPTEAAAFIDRQIKELNDGDGDRRAQFLIARAVGMLGEVEGVNLSTELYRFYDQGDEQVRAAAARALERQGDVSLMQREISAILPDLNSSDDASRVRAIDRLGSTGSNLASSYLVPLLTDADSEVRLRTLDALRRTGDASTIDKIEPLLNDPVAYVRERAARAMESLRNPDRDRGRDRGFPDFGDFRGGR